MSNRDAMWELVKQLSGQQNVIAIPRVYQKVMGSWEGAAFLNQIIYWSDKGKDGTFAHTANEWEVELGLSRYEVEKNSRILKDAGVMRTEVRKFRGVPTVHYTLLITEFQQWICEFFTDENAKNSRNDMLKIHESYTEIISETTPETIVFAPELLLQTAIPEAATSPVQAPTKAKKPNPKREAAAAAEAARLARLTFGAEDALLVAAIAPAYAAKGWAPPVRYQNDAQQQKYRECLAALGPDDTRRAIDRCLVQGRIGLDNIISSLMSWVANNQRKPSAPPRDPPPQQPAAYAGLRDYISERMP